MRPGERDAWAKRVAELQARPKIVTSVDAAPRIEWPGTTAPPAPKPGRVRGAKVTHVDGIRFASKLEADRYRELKLLQLATEVVYFLRQVPFVVAPGVLYRLDFLIVWRGVGDHAKLITYEDTKGHMTDVAKIKLASVQERYGITIKILTRKDVSR